MFTAEGLTERFSQNKNLVLPRRPGIASDLVPVRLSHGALAYVGGSTPVLLHGRSVNEQLPSLLPLLHGQFQLGELSALVGPSVRPVLDDLLRFLFARGLLVEHEGQPALSDAQMRRHASFFERYCSELTLSSGAPPAQRLQRGRVLLDGAATWAKALRRALLDAGLQVQDIDTVSAAGGELDAGPVLAVFDPARAHALSTWLAVADRQQDWRCLPLSLDEAALRLGPVLKGRDCLADQVAPNARPSQGVGAAALWAVAAHWLLMVLADATTQHWQLNRMEIDVQSLNWRSVGQPLRPIVGAGFVANYHRNTCDRPLRSSSRQHLISYEPAQVAKVRGASKRYNGRAWPWLPAGTADADAKAQLLSWAGHCLRLREHPSQVPIRPVPSAGNLASQSLYLIHLDEADASAGVHYLHADGLAYQVAGLAQARRLKDSLGEATTALVATAALARLESKYGHKAYRFAHYDSGVMLAALQASAQGSQAALHVCADLDDALFEQVLGLDGHTELVCWLALALPQPAATGPAAKAANESNSVKVETL